MIRRLLFLAAVGVLCALFLRTFVVEGIYVASGSMEPTLHVGTNLFLEKVSFRFRRPRRGDIIVFRSPIEKRKDLIKRVIAVAGDTVELRDKELFLNGSKLSEPYAQHTRPGEKLLGDTLGTLVVPEHMLFVLGDNRDESGDSRDWKDPVSGEHIYFVPVWLVKGRIIQFQ